MNTAVLCLVFIAAAVLAQQPQAPVWPDAWTANFNETSTLIGKGNTNGTYWYDFKNGKTRMDRLSGKFDRYCGSVYKLVDTPCSHIIVDGNRYLYFPQKNYCCNCCNAAKGCGIMKNDWLNNATFVGYETLFDRKCEKWDKKGLQDNFYYNTADDARIPVKIDMVPNDVIVFNIESYRAAPIDPSIFQLPSQCSASTKCPFFSICSLLN